MAFSNVIDCLKERGFIDALTSEEVREKLKHPTRVYVGFDPTADSLHIGSLVGIIALGWFQRYGHTPVVILGGATGRIGDPSGKSQERPLLDSQTIAQNIARIRDHFDKVLDFKHPATKPLMLNNEDWYAGMSLIDFLRDVGKHFRLQGMLAKESVRARLESEEGLSFTEFTYQLLQAYDFYYLSQQYGVTVQLGGSDQWGNITAGTELVRKLNGESVYGITFPLLTRSDGKKFGKTEGGAIWLAPDRTSPYQFYQYFVRVADSDVIKLMRMITFMDMEEIRRYEEEMKKPGYAPNTAQKRLAEEVTRLIHGEEGLQIALRVTETAAPGSQATLDVERLEAIALEMPNVVLSLSEVVGEKFIDLMAKTGLSPSKSEALKLLKNGGAYLNDQKVDDQALRIQPEHLIGNRYILLGMGKKKKLLLKIQ